MLKDFKSQPKNNWKIKLISLVERINSKIQTTNWQIILEIFRNKPNFHTKQSNFWKNWKYFPRFNELSGSFRTAYSSEDFFQYFNPREEIEKEFHDN
jgi:hypothetical protein